MAKFTDYTQKTKPADADLLLIHDNAGAANKKTPFSGVWSWILDKLASAVISQLETTNKSIIPAINELNSKTTKTYAKQTSASYPVLKIIPSFSSGNMISFVNRNGRVDIYVYNSNDNIAISTKHVYGQNYEVVSDGSAIYIKVDADTINFVSSLYDCSVGAVQSLPS